MDFLQIRSLEFLHAYVCPTELIFDLQFRDYFLLIQPLKLTMGQKVLVVEIIFYIHKIILFSYWEHS